jgi:hypothetical protein
MAMVRCVDALRGAAVVALPVVMAATGACSTAGQSEAGGQVELRATLQRATLFETRRALKLSVRNTGADEVELGTVQLSSPLFEPVAPEAREARLAAGGRPSNIPLRFGAAVCSQDDGDGSEAEGGDTDDARAELVATVDGEERRIALEQRPTDMLADLHAGECAAAGVLARVDVQLGDRWTPAGPRTLAGEITMSPRRPGVSADLDSLLGNVIFAVAPGPPVAEGDPWLAVGGDRTSDRLPVTIRAARCDPHALIEYKRTFIFVALLAVDGDEPVRVDIEAAGGARRALERLLTSCLESP